MKTVFAKPGTVRGDWFVVDASDQTLGRLASQIAHRLKGKHKADYSPHVDMPLDARRRSIRGRNTRQPRFSASVMRGAASSSQGSAAYSAMRDPLRSCRERSTCSATMRERCARCCGVTRRRRALSTARNDLRALPKVVKSGSVTRVCRCEPLLSNQSNKWDELRQVRLSARRRTCTVLRASRKSRGCFN